MQSRRAARGRRGHGGGRRRQHDGTAAVGRADERHPRRRDDVPRDGGDDRVPRARCRRGEGKGAAGAGVGGRARRGRASASTSRPRRARRSSDASARSSSLVGTLERARQQRSPELVTLIGVPGHRQEPSRRRAVPVDRARRRADVLAARTLAAVRRGRQLLGAGGDGEGAGRHPRDRQRRGGRREARARGRAADRGGRGLGALTSASARRSGR